MEIVFLVVLKAGIVRLKYLLEKNVKWTILSSQENGQQGQPVMPAVAGGLYLRRRLEDVSGADGRGADG